LSHSKAGAHSLSAAARQRQFPSARPGTFIRASAPKLSTSCSGASVSAATDDQASRTSDAAASLLCPEGRFRYCQRFHRWPSDNSSNQPRVVLLSCVPVYTTEFGE